MSSKKRRPKRLPAIVPRFLKSAVTIGAIPALAACEKGHPRVQPVVAQYSQPVVAAYAADAEMPSPPPPVVAAMVPSPVVAAMVPPQPAPQDAGVDAPAAKKKTTKRQQPPPPPVVAAMVAPPFQPPPPPVVAAMVPHNGPSPVGPAAKPKSKKP